MYVRLAFAVSAHLEPDILVVDEVLAVGDAVFQKKCLGKMQDVSKAGRTVLFVSHNMAVIQALCPTAIVLENGRVKFLGSSVDAASAYLMAAPRATALERAAQSDGTPTITKLKLMRVECLAETVIDIEVEITSGTKKGCSIEVRLFDALGSPLGLASLGLLDGDKKIGLIEGSKNFRCLLRLPRIARGTYRLSVDLAIPMVEYLDRIEEALCFDVHPAPVAGYERVMESAWGYGALEIPMELEDLGETTSRKRIPEQLYSY